MKWDHPKNSAHSQLRDTRMEAAAAETLGQFSVLELTTTVHVGNHYIILG